MINSEVNSRQMESKKVNQSCKVLVFFFFEGLMRNDLDEKNIVKIWWVRQRTRGKTDVCMMDQPDRPVYYDLHEDSS